MVHDITLNYTLVLIVLTMAFTLLEFNGNKNYKNKQTTVLFILLVIHYFIWVFSFLSIIFVLYYGTKMSMTFLLVYLSTIIFIKIQWYVLENRCFLTSMVNDLVKQDDTAGFRDPIDIIFQRYPIAGESNKSKTSRDIIMDGIIITYVFIVLYTIHKKRFK